MLFKTESKFFIFGCLNFVITNIILQWLLIISTAYFATFVSQIVNFLIGYFLYSKFVFIVRLREKSFFFRYLFLAILSWNINFISINFLSIKFSFSKNLAALIMIPLLTIFSFVVQKYYVFAKR